MFQDHFAKLAQQYAQYRPKYPGSLFARLSRLVENHTLAWDCATGSGQAALGLAQFFYSVAASDASAGQMAHAIPHPRIRYFVARSEQVPLAARSVNLAVVAQAVHWFELDRFYAEVRRVLQPGGILAVWGYHFGEAETDIDRVVQAFYYDTVGPYWPAQLRQLEEGYRSLPFPFQRVVFPEIAMAVEWDLDMYMGFISSWSAVRRYQEARGTTPLPELQRRLGQAWGNPKEIKLIRWPLYIKVGKT